MAIGWGTFLGALGKIFSKIPIQDRKERWKNEIDTLNKERSEILKGKPDEKKANRISAINERLNILNQWMRNSSDAG